MAVRKRLLFVDGPNYGHVSTYAESVGNRAPQIISVPIYMPLTSIRVMDDRILDNMLRNINTRVFDYHLIPGIYPFYHCYSVDFQEPPAYLATQLIELAVEQQLANTADEVTKKFTQRIDLLESRLKELSKTVNAVKFLTDIAESLKSDQ